MQSSPVVAVFLIAGFMGSCSHQQIYEGIKQNRKNRCELLQGAQRDECLQQYDKSDDQYKKERPQVDSEYVDHIA